MIPVPVVVAKSINIAAEDENKRSFININNISNLKLLLIIFVIIGRMEGWKIGWIND